jgi:hypothetical protein
MKDEEVYVKALDVLNDALDGKTVNPVAVSTATNMLAFVWSAVYQERLKREQIKDAIRESFDEYLNEKKDKQ